MRKRVIGGLVAAVVVLGIGGSIAIADAVGSANSASCNSTSYDGSTLNITCTVPQVTVTSTVTAPGPTVTVTQTVTASPSPTDTTTPTPTVTPTPTPTPTTTSPGTPTGFPDASNTGVPAGTTLKAVPGQVTSGTGWHWDSRGWVEIDGNGAVFSGYSLNNAGVDVTASNVTISNNSILARGDGWALSLRHTSNVKILNNTIFSDQTGSGRLENAIRSIYNDDANLDIEKNNIYNASTGINNISGSATIKDNYIHDFASTGSDHNNGIQLEAGNGPIVITHNTIENKYAQTDAIILSNDGGGTENNRTISNNFLAVAGTRSMALVDQARARPTPRS